MTRENKLVMVIGFGLLLFVGILVSDHLSARDSQFSNPASTVEVSLQRERELPPSGDERIAEFGRPERANELPPQVDGVRIVRETDERGTIVVGQSPTQQAPMHQTLTAPVAAERTHTVAKGENPEKIAQKYYGRRSLAGALAKYNGIDPTKLKIGQVLKVPDVSVIDPSAAPVVSDAGTQFAPESAQAEPVRTEAPPVAKTAAKTAATTEVRTRTATVQKGDNLWKIAERTMGKGSNANVAKLKAMNPGLSEKNLKIGAQIKVASAA